MHWEQLGNVLDRPSQLRLPPSIPASRGVYAPTIRHYGGRFYVITTLVGAGGTFLVSSDRPEGPWSDPVWSDLPGIDPDLAWDEDGECWCAVSGVNVARIDPERGHCVSVARARSPRGPYESAPGNPILTHRSTNRPIQSTGHGDLVQAADGACR